MKTKETERVRLVGTSDDNVCVGQDTKNKAEQIEDSLKFLKSKIDILDEFITGLTEGDKVIGEGYDMAGMIGTAAGMAVRSKQPIGNLIRDLPKYITSHGEKIQDMLMKLRDILE